MPLFLTPPKNCQLSEMTLRGRRGKRKNQYCPDYSSTDEYSDMDVDTSSEASTKIEVCINTFLKTFAKIIPPS